MNRMLTIAGLLMLMGLTTRPLRSETITLAPGDETGQIDITSLSPINFGAGGPPVTFFNATGLTFTDLDFSTDIAQPNFITGDGSLFFDSLASTTTTLRFFNLGTDIIRGMPPSTVFTVTNTGFVSGTTLTMTPTVPEPSSLALLGAGTLILMGYEWRRRRTQLGASR